ncbi:hypothetical protein Tco_1380387 [Tanacetum coccineum]
MSCSLPHTDSEVEALVQKLIDEDNGRQNAILDLALQFETSCTAKDDLRKKPPVSPISSYPTIEESSYPTIEESVEEHEYLTEGGLIEDELHQLAKDEEALKEVLEEEAKREKQKCNL